MTSSYAAARAVALIYAAVVFTLLALNAANLLMEANPPWRKVVSWSVIALLAPLIPMAVLRLGIRMARTERGHRIAAAGTLFAAAVTVVVGGVVLLSTEPLAALALLYVPPFQFLVLVATLVGIAITNRA